MGFKNGACFIHILFFTVYRKPAVDLLRRLLADTIRRVKGHRSFRQPTYNIGYAVPLRLTPCSTQIAQDYYLNYLIILIN